MARQTPAELKPACSLVSLKHILERKTSYAACLRCLSALYEVFFRKAQPRSACAKVGTS